MSFVDSGNGVKAAADTANDLSDTLDIIERKTDKLKTDFGSFAEVMFRAFRQAVRGGKQFDDVLKSVALRLSELAVKSAFKALEKGIGGDAGDILSDIFGKTGPSVIYGMGAIKPFAAGGVIGAPSYFPLSSGGLGLAGEAGPEAIVPLTRGRDGRLGVAMAGQAAGPNVTVQIMTPDVASFQRSEAYVTGQIARAVARGQRGM
jgi:phage-related minor tail protein